MKVCGGIPRPPRAAFSSPVSGTRKKGAVLLEEFERAVAGGASLSSRRRPLSEHVHARARAAVSKYARSGLKRERETGGFRVPRGTEA